MDSTLLLVTIISLLYKESLCEGRENSAELTKKIIKTIKINETLVEGDPVTEILTSLRATAIWMIGNPPGYRYEKTSFLQRIRLNTLKDESMYRAIESCALLDTVDLTPVIASINSDINTLREYERMINIQEAMYKAYREICFSNSDTISEKIEKSKNFLSELEPFLYTAERSHAIVSEIDYDDEEALASLFRETLDEISGEGVMRLGWQAYNRMCGYNGGYRRGEMILAGALQHHWKSGLAIANFRQIPYYNKPYMINPNKKPCVVRITCENELKNDNMEVYKSVYEMVYGTEIDITKLKEGEFDEKEAARFIKEALSRNGYTIKMYRVDPSLFTFHELFNLIDQLEAAGYEIHFMEVDYVAMMNTAGCFMGAQGSQFRDLFRRIRNKTTRHLITFLTPHQLSPDAKELERQGVDNFIQRVVNKGYYDSCKGLDQEVDLEIALHKVTVGDETFLEFGRGKHRGLISPTPERDKYFVMKFEKIGPIPDDIHGRDLSRKRVGAATSAEGGANAWWDR